MQLKDYRKNVAKISRAALAEIIGCDAVSIWRYETGRTMPNRFMIARIMEWSKGRVKATDLMAAGDDKGRA